MILFKSKSTTEPSKLASAIAHNIKNSSIEISCLGEAAVNATVKALIIAKKYTQNEPFQLGFDFFTIEESDPEGNILKIIQVVVSKKEKGE